MSSNLSLWVGYSSRRLAGALAVKMAPASRLCRTSWKNTYHHRFTHMIACRSRDYKKPALSTCPTVLGILSVTRGDGLLRDQPLITGKLSIVETAYTPRREKYNMYLSIVANDYFVRTAAGLLDIFEGVLSNINIVYIGHLP